MRITNYYAIDAIIEYVQCFFYTRLNCKKFSKWLNFCILGEYSDILNAETVIKEEEWTDRGIKRIYLQLNQIFQLW